MLRVIDYCLIVILDQYSTCAFTMTIVHLSPTFNLDVRCDSDWQFQILFCGQTPILQIHQDHPITR